MFDIQLAAVAAASTPTDGVLACARLENAACAARLGHMADLLAAAHAADGSADREQWCFDNWSAVCASIGAAHAITSGLANGLLTDAVVLRERLPQVAQVFADGLIGYRLVHQICARTGLVRDGDTLAVLDAAMAEMVLSVGAMSKDQAEKNIDTLVLMLDPLAVVRTQTKSRGHRVDVHVDDATGTAHVDADLSVPHAQAFDKRVDALARTVCDRDPRDMDARRAAALGAMGFGWDRLPCLCGSPDDCEAATTPAVGGIVIYMIAHQETLDASTDGASSGGPSEAPAPDGGPRDEPGDGPDGGPSNEPQDPDGGPGEGPHGGPNHGPDSPDGGPGDDPKDLDGGPGDGDLNAESSTPKADDTDDADDATGPADDAAGAADDAEVGAGDGESARIAAESEPDTDTDTDTESEPDTEPLAEAKADRESEAAPGPPPTPPPDSPLVGDLTAQRHGLVSPAPALLPEPWPTDHWSALSAALTVERGELCPTRPGVILRGPVVPAPVVAQAATHATIRTLIHPGQAPPEPRYRPSKALAEFVRCRDQTCRFPACTRPAIVTDIDHTVPYPWGPTAASNLACLCREHHLMKTFWPGWSNRQYPDGRIDWTDPDGNPITTYPGSRLLFPELCEPTAETTVGGVPPPKHTAGLNMPKRKTTRKCARRQRINDERQHNIPLVAQRLREGFIPF